jgi:hypothetical protein
VPSRLLDSEFIPRELILSPGCNVRMTAHPSDTDLERYSLGAIQEGPELDGLEEHLLICGECVDRALASDAYVGKIRATLVKCVFGLRSFSGGKAAE